MWRRVRTLMFIDFIGNMKEYLYNEWKRTVHPKYIKYFDEWFNNLTETQKLYFEAYSKGLKTPF